MFTFLHNLRIFPRTSIFMRNKHIYMIKKCWFLVIPKDPLNQVLEMIYNQRLCTRFDFSSTRISLKNHTEKVNNKKEQRNTWWLGALRVWFACWWKSGLWDPIGEVWGKSLIPCSSPHSLSRCSSLGTHSSCSYSFFLFLFPPENQTTDLNKEHLQSQFFLWFEKQ